MLKYTFLYKNPVDIDYVLYRKKYLAQNRERSVMLSIGALIIYIVLNSIWLYFDISTESTNINYFSRNLIILSITALIVLSYNYFYSRVQFLQNEILSQAIILLISICILSTSSLNSFVISQDPKNNLTPILVGAISVSSLFRFNVLEGLFLNIVGLIFFSSLFFIWPNSQYKYAMNLSVVFNIYLLAFIINRSIHNNAYRLFKQIRMNESINFTLKNTIKQKDDVLEIVVHDLRGPIANIKEMAWQIEHAANKEAEYNTYLPLIQESCDNAEMVINDLISVAKIKNIEDPINTVCINDLTGTLVDFIRNTNPTRKIIYTASAKKYYSTIYPDKLKRILLNLISNSLKFTPDNKKIEVKLYEFGNYNIIEVSDEGVGIDPALTNNLFDKFSKASKTGLKGEESVGLGLYIVKVLTELMNGKVEYFPNGSQGSIFRLSFPKHL